MGLIAVDRHAESQIMNIDGVHVLEQAHAREHSLEVQLPFLQYLLEDFKIVPIVAGHASQRAWGSEPTTLSRATSGQQS